MYTVIPTEQSEKDVKYYIKKKGFKHIGADIKVITDELEKRNLIGTEITGLEENIEKIANVIMETGVKEKDAYHVACAVIAECNYFVTTDDRLLKYQSEKIELVTPGEFIRRMEADR